MSIVDKSVAGCNLLMTCAQVHTCTGSQLWPSASERTRTSEKDKKKKSCWNKVKDIIKKKGKELVIKQGIDDTIPYRPIEIQDSSSICILKISDIQQKRKQRNRPRQNCLTSGVTFT